eukprot:gene1502-2897_t
MSTVPEGFLRSCAQLFTFRDSLPKSTDVEKAFVSSVGNEDTSAFMHNLTTSRQIMTNELANPSSTTSARLNTVTQYIPEIYRLLESLNKSESDVHLDKRLVFEWRGGLIITDTWTPYEEVLYDIIMALHTKALLHNKIAIEAIQTELTNETTVLAGKHFRIAAGIMSHLSTGVLPKWASARGRPNLPPECSEPLCLALCHWFTAEAQIMATIKAIQGNIVPSLLAKISLAVVKELECSIDILLRRLQPEYRLKIPFNDFIYHLCVMKELYLAMVCKYQAEAMLAAGEAGVGTAIALCMHAKKRLQEQKGKVHNPDEPGLPPKIKGKGSPNLSPALLFGVQCLHSMLDTIESGARRENDLIYHVMIPSESSLLPELPHAALIMPPEPFVEPQSSLLIFKYEPIPIQPPKKDSIFSFFR